MYVFGFGTLTQTNNNPLGLADHKESCLSWPVDPGMVAVSWKHAQNTVRTQFDFSCKHAHEIRLQTI